MFLLADLNKRKSLDFEGVTVFYTECSGMELRRSRSKHADPLTGDVDTVAVVVDMLKAHIVGWENHRDAEGRDIPFNEANLAFVIENLTPTALGRLDLAISANLREGVASGKDSVNGSNG